MNAAAAISISIPEESGIRMIEQCVTLLERALTIRDVLRVASQADAIATIMRKVKASERAKHAALRLQLNAETALGALTKHITQGRTGRAAACRPGQATKTEALKAMGLNSNRVNIAERLAEKTDAELEDAMCRSTSKTVTGVAAVLGLRKSAPYVSVSSMRKVARDAIGLLVQCQTTPRAPRTDEVEALREAFSAAEARALT